MKYWIITLSTKHGEEEYRVFAQVNTKKEAEKIKSELLDNDAVYEEVDIVYEDVLIVEQPDHDMKYFKIIYKNMDYDEDYLSDTFEFTGNGWISVDEGYADFIEQFDLPEIGNDVIGLNCETGQSGFVIELI